MDGTSFLDAGEIPEVRQLVRDAFRTVLNLRPHSVQILRWDEGAGNVVTLPGTYEVSIRYGGGQANDRLGLTADVSEVRGDIRSFDPFPIQTGDRFPLGEGSFAIVTPPGPYEKYGIIHASWTVDQGAV
jgi:hypothetical protein